MVSVEVLHGPDVISKKEQNTIASKSILFITAAALSSFAVQSAKNVKYSAIIASPAKPEDWILEALGADVGLAKSEGSDVLKSGVSTEVTVESGTILALYQQCAIRCVYATVLIQ